MSSSVDTIRISAFLDRQRTLLQAERQAEVEQSSLLLSSCPPKLLEKKGLALLGLGVVNVGLGLGGKSMVELERPTTYHISPLFPPHSLRPGDLVRIDENTIVAAGAATKKAPKAGKVAAPKESSPEGPEGVVYKVSNTRIVIAIDPSQGGDDLDLPERCRVVKLANSVTFDRMDRAVDQMSRILLGTIDEKTKTTPPAPNSLLRVLFGFDVPSKRHPLQALQFFDPSLNSSQQAAVKLALESPELALIHGPPGTGKTHTLVEITRQLVEVQNLKVLICGASNLSVDNLLERLLPHKIPLIRLGHPARVLSGLHRATLDAQAEASDEAALAKDVKKDIEDVMGQLTRNGKKGRVKGAQRKKMWEEVRELKKEYRKREGTVVKTIVSGAKIVLATCHAAGGRQLADRQFDVVIIDEAAQALEAVCWIPILKAKKLILAGDNLQLPPTVKSIDKKKKKPNGKSLIKTTGKALPKVESTATSVKGKGKAKAMLPPPAPDPDPTSGGGEDDCASDDEDSHDETELSPASKPIEVKAKEPRPLGILNPSKSLEVTLFDRMEKMWGEDIKQLLTVQYRMNTKICDFPSKTLYSSMLTSDASVASRLLSNLPDLPNATDSKDTLEHEVVFFDTAGCEFFERIDGGEGTEAPFALGDEGSKCNVNEVEVVRKWVEELVSCGIQPSQIAIITPYQAQLSLISSVLLPTMDGLEIGTVDGMQGREKEAVILSLVRSNDKREVGFLKEKRRMNVAMTRPRRHLCVIGDSSTIQHGSPYLKKWMAWLEENADVRFAGEG